MNEHVKEVCVLAVPALAAALALMIAVHMDPMAEIAGEAQEASPTPYSADHARIPAPLLAQAAAPTF